MQDADEAWSMEHGAWGMEPTEIANCAFGMWDVKYRLNEFVRSER